MAALTPPVSRCSPFPVKKGETVLAVINPKL